MEAKKGKINIELRSEEVQELMGKIPPMILRFGIGIILMILLLFFVASFYIKYPTYETVSVKLNIGESTRDVAMPFDGIIVDVKIKDGEQVGMHDTLVVISNPTQAGNDTMSLHSPLNGTVYARDFFEKGETVRQGTPLFVVRQDGNEKLTGKCYVSLQIKQKIATGAEVECIGQEIAVNGKISKIAEVMNPSQKGYAVEIAFEGDLLPKEIEATDAISAKFQTSDKTIFELFFLKSMFPKI